MERTRNEPPAPFSSRLQGQRAERAPERSSVLPQGDPAHRAPRTAALPGSLVRAAVLIALFSGAAAGGCAANVNDVLWEARHGESEYVAEAVDRLGELLARKQAAGTPFDKGDREALSYLRDVGEKSPDPTLRARAVSALIDLRSVDLAEYFISRLDDAFWPVRLEAARGLALGPSTRAGEALAERLRAEAQPEVRANLIRALSATGGDAALKALLEVLIDDSSRFQNLRLRAYDAVRTMSGKDFDLEARREWGDYYAERFGTKGTSPDGGRAILSGEIPSSPGEQP